jgi:NADH-quinone oxidoreductase subunit H
VGIDVIGLLMAGWASNSKYALLGSVRSVAQVVSYEIPTGLAVLAAVLAYGTLNFQDIVLAQSTLGTSPQPFWFIGDVQPYGGILSWGIIRYPHLLLAFVVYFIAGLAEANRAPFDLPEAESELVAGYHTEYTGYRFAVLMLAEYGVMLLVGLVGAALFLGGWNTPLPNLQALPVGVSASELTIGELFSHLQFAHLTTGTPGTFWSVLWGLFWLLGKSTLLVLVMMWIRWTFPRLRPDHLMRLCWQYLVPLGLLLVLVSAAWRLMEVG